MESAGVRWDAWEAVSEALGERCARLRPSSHPPPPPPLRRLPSPRAPRWGDSQGSCALLTAAAPSPPPFPPPRPLFGQRGPKGEVGTVKH